jgi:hypothetical protein
MNTATAIYSRTCPDCGAYLSERNPGPRCWPCAEKKLLQSIYEPPKARIVNSSGPGCDNCGRTGLYLRLSRYGKRNGLCSSCQHSTVHKTREQALEALEDLRIKNQGKGKYRSGKQ